jgi:hypothetical protein
MRIAVLPREKRQHGIKDTENETYQRGRTGDLRELWTGCPETKISKLDLDSKRRNRETNISLTWSGMQAGQFALLGRLVGLQKMPLVQICSDLQDKN